MPTYLFLGNNPFVVNGLWTEWASSPEAYCDGKHWYKRSCTNPAPAHGGSDCVGDTVKTEECVEVCPTLSTTGVSSDTLAVISML